MRKFNFLMAMALTQCICLIAHTYAIRFMHPELTETQLLIKFWHDSFFIMMFIVMIIEIALAFFYAWRDR
jgi:heme/copper-type cytochrome/quinol oxidase subunit 2